MHIEPGWSGVSMRALSFKDPPKGERDTLQSLQDDKTHNVYFAPGLSPLLANQRAPTPRIHYSLASTRTVFYAAHAPVNDKGLLNAEGKLVLDVADIVTSTGATELWGPHAPNIAGIMPEVNIFVGVVGCYDKLSHTGLQKRIGGGFCLADMVVKTLLLLGHFVPGLQHMASYLMYAQIGIKIGDGYVEYKFSGNEKPGQKVLKAVEISVSNSDVVVLPLNSLGTLVTGGPRVATFTQNPPPAS